MCALARFNAVKWNLSLELRSIDLDGRSIRCENAIENIDHSLMRTASLLLWKWKSISTSFCFRNWIVLPVRCVMHYLATKSLSKWNEKVQSTGVLSSVKTGRTSLFAFCPWTLNCCTSFGFPELFGLPKTLSSRSSCRSNERVIEKRCADLSNSTNTFSLANFIHSAIRKRGEMDYEMQMIIYSVVLIGFLLKNCLTKRIKFIDNSCKSKAYMYWWTPSAAT